MEGKPRLQSGNGPEVGLERARVAREHERLIARAERQTDTVRRGWTFCIEFSVALVACVFVPLVPSAHRLFGPLTFRGAAFCFAPGIVALWINFILYRKLSGALPDGERPRDARAEAIYNVAEGVESAVLYGTLHGVLYGSAGTAVAAWPIMPFAIAFWAFIRPSRARRHVIVVAVTHGVLAAAFAASGSLRNAGYAVLSGMISGIFAVWVARVRLHDLLLEAQRNSMVEAVHRGNLARERARVLAWLQESVGNELGVIAAAANIDARAAAQAVSLQNDLFDITRGPDDAHVRLDVLARRIDLKAQQLCPEGVLVVRRNGEDLPLPGDHANALLRIAQEFVRNAVTHGKATRIDVELATTEATVELRVCDNGRGLPGKALAGQGGLANAKSWLSEAHGSLVIAPAEPPFATALYAILPRKSLATPLRKMVPSEG